MHIPISLIPFSIPKLKEFKNHQSHEEQRQERQERRDEYRKDKPNDEDVRIENIWHEILGVSQNAHFEEIASAYKRLIISYHPDKFKHLGPDFEIVANKRAKNINAAYDYAKKLHGKS